MLGDRQALMNRLRRGEVHEGQCGMLPGDNIKDYIRDLNALHSSLWAVVPGDERDSVIELSDHNMKITLETTVNAELSIILSALQASDQDTTYTTMCICRHALAF